MVREGKGRRMVEKSWVVRDYKIELSLGSTFRSHEDGEKGNQYE